MSSLFYTRAFILPDGFQAPPGARDSIDQAVLAAESPSPQSADQLMTIARSAFDQGFAASIWTAAALVFLVAAYIAVSTRDQPKLTGSH